MRLNLDDNMTEHFKLSELLWLPQWRIHCFPTKLQYENLVTFIHQVERMRRFLKRSFIVTSCLRPDIYNSKIGGSAGSRHMRGRAIDFTVKGMSCKEARIAMKPKLDEYNLRMENINGNWIHLDNGKPGISGRFFKPY